jgi:hypothetical protein
MRQIAIIVILCLSALPAFSEDSTLFKIIVRSPYTGTISDSAEVELDGRRAGYNAAKHYYELSVPLTKLIKVEVSLPGTVTARFNYYSRYFNVTDAVQVGLGREGCRYLRAEDHVTAVYPDSTRLGIVVDHKTGIPDTSLLWLIDSLGLVIDHDWEKLDSPEHRNRITFPYIVVKRKDKAPFGSSDEIIVTLKLKGYIPGIFFMEPKYGMYITSPLIVQIYNNAARPRARDLFKSLGLSETSYKGSEFVLEHNRPSLGYGLLDLLQALTDSGFVNYAYTPVYGPPPRLH